MTCIAKDICRSCLLAVVLTLASGCALQKKTGAVAKPRPEAASASSQASSSSASMAAAAPPESKSVRPATPAKPEADDKNSLAEGIELYEAGKYNSAIQRLRGAFEIGKDNTADQLTALKYMAFSYCLTGRKTLCRKQFARAFQIDPAFDLDAGEKGHPLWTPQFEHARQARRAKASTGARKTN